MAFSFSTAETFLNSHEHHSPKPSSPIWTPVASFELSFLPHLSFPCVLLAKWLFLERFYVTVPHCFLLNPYLNLLFKACLKRARLTIYSNLLLLQHKAIVKNEVPKELPFHVALVLTKLWLRKVIFTESKDCDLKLQNLRTGKNVCGHPSVFLTSIIPVVVSGFRTFLIRLR